jgi:uncharacterized protein (TIGR03663 family)
MKRAVQPVLLLAAVLAVAAALRLPDLGARPMHADEAVQAAKFGDLLEHGTYAYDPDEYHGPALNYLTLPVAWIRGVHTLRETTETDLRLMPALLGVGLVALVWLLRRDLGTTATAAAMLLTSLSPSLVFYSRYYIAEPLLAFFTFGAIVAGWRLACAMSDPGVARRARLTWALIAGACAGMMHASKETFAIPLLAAGIGVAATVALAGRDARRAFAAGLRRAAPALALAALVAAAVSVLFFSSLLSNPRGVLDSVGTYARYLGRAGGRADAAWHVHPWYYYASAYFVPRRTDGIAWTEVLLLLLAVTGVFLACRPDADRPLRHHLVRFLAVYALATFTVYSVIPYKTPWCVMTFVQALAVLGGIGAAAAAERARHGARAWVLVVLLALACTQLARQAWAAAFRANDDRTCPYAYVQTTADIPALAAEVKRLANGAPGGGPRVQVMATGHDYWPLPWYLRRLDRVGYYAAVPAGPLAPILIVSPDLQADLTARLFAPGSRSRLYVDLARTWRGGRIELRPNVPLEVYVRADLWESLRLEETPNDP